MDLDNRDDLQNFYDQFIVQYGSTQDSIGSEYFGNHWLDLTKVTSAELDSFIAAINRLPSLGGDVHSRSQIRFVSEVTVNSQNSWFSTGIANDSIAGTEQADRVLSREGHDRISLRDGDDVVFSNEGHDVVFGGDGDDVVYLQNGNDFGRGDQGNDVLYGGDGNDRLRGEDGNDKLFGGAGLYDKIYGNAGDDTLYGEEGDDWLWASEGNDTAYGGEDNDSIWGGQGDDLLIGGDGDDWEEGGRGNDTILGGRGDDEMHGNSGDDFLACRDGRDWMNGEGGNDTLLTISDGGRPTYNALEESIVEEGSNADDRLTGGDGADSFEFNFQLGATEEYASQFTDKNGQIDWAALANDPRQEYWVNSGGVDRVDDFNASQGDTIIIRGQSISIADLILFDSSGDGNVDSTRVVLNSAFNVSGSCVPDLVGILIFDDVLLEESQLQIDGTFIEGSF